jgi:hypothetical protein
VEKSGITVTTEICGEAAGVDQLGKRWALDRGIPVESCPAKWEKFGRSAGPIRNAEMAARAHALIAIWDGKSPGTKDMIKAAKAKGLQVFVHQV